MAVGPAAAALVSRTAMAASDLSGSGLVGELQGPHHDHRPREMAQDLL